MIKRHLTSLLFLLVSMITLAHAIIPHHHHSSLVCVVNSHCASDGEAHEHEAPLDDHKHEGANNPENCVLKQLVAIPNNHGRQNNYYCEYSTYQFAVAFFNANDNNSGIGNFNADGFVIARLPFLSSSYSNFVIYSLGLRAPPIV